jgi:hypothetical protein
MALKIGPTSHFSVSGSSIGGSVEAINVAAGSILSKNTKLGGALSNPGFVSVYCVSAYNDTFVPLDTSCD